MSGSERSKYLKKLGIGTMKLDKDYFSPPSPRKEFKQLCREIKAISESSIKLSELDSTSEQSSLEKKSQDHLAHKIERALEKVLDKIDACSHVDEPGKTAGLKFYDKSITPRVTTKKFIHSREERKAFAAKLAQHSPLKYKEKDFIPRTTELKTFENAAQNSDEHALLTLMLMTMTKGLSSGDQNSSASLAINGLQIELQSVLGDYINACALETETTKTPKRK